MFVLIKSNKIVLNMKCCFISLHTDNWHNNKKMQKKRGTIAHRLERVEYQKDTREGLKILEKCIKKGRKEIQQNAHRVKEKIKSLIVFDINELC